VYGTINVKKKGKMQQQPIKKNQKKNEGNMLKLF
jgi:hypothetical protein